MTKDRDASKPATVAGDRTEGQARVTVGVEQVLYRAATDPAFRNALLQDRTAALEELSLTPVEATILQGADRSALERMIDGVQMREHGRRRFMQGVAAVAAGVATGAVVVTGISCVVTGSRPNPDPDGGMQQTRDATDLPVGPSTEEPSP
jgi:hypothetical protein